MSARAARHCAAVNAVGEVMSGEFMARIVADADCDSRDAVAGTMPVMRTSIAVLLLLVSGAASSQALYVVPDGVETRWASAENPAGERGHGGVANAGRKGAAFFVLKAGESRTLAE